MKAEYYPVAEEMYIACFARNGRFKYSGKVVEQSDFCFKIEINNGTLVVRKQFCHIHYTVEKLEREVRKSIKYFEEQVDFFAKERFKKKEKPTKVAENSTEIVANLRGFPPLHPRNIPPQGLTLHFQRPIVGFHFDANDINAAVTTHTTHTVAAVPPDVAFEPDAVQEVRRARPLSWGTEIEAAAAAWRRVYNEVANGDTPVITRENDQIIAAIDGAALERSLASNV
jgi:hypothetical protein